MTPAALEAPHCAAALHNIVGGIGATPTASARRSLNGRELRKWVHEMGAGRVGPAGQIGLKH